MRPTLVALNLSKYLAEWNLIEMLDERDQGAIIHRSLTDFAVENANKTGGKVFAGHRLSIGPITPGLKRSPRPHLSPPQPRIKHHTEAWAMAEPNNPILNEDWVRHLGFRYVRVSPQS